ncbi:MAG: AMMECR1 domain-containing protein [Candidatus Absconditabacteria bacterium]
MNKKIYIGLGLVALASSFVRAVNSNIIITNEIKVKIEEELARNPMKLDSYYVSIDKLIQAVKEQKKDVEALNDIKVFLKEIKNNEHKISHKSKLQIVKYAYNKLDSIFESNILTGDSFQLFAMRDSKLFVTFLNDGKIRCCQSGTTKLQGGERVMGVLGQAVNNCVGDSRFGTTIKKSELKDIDMVFNFLFNKTKIPNSSLVAISKNIQLGIHGIQLQSGKKSAFFKESVPISKNYDLQTTLSRLCLKAGLDDECYTSPDVTLYKYDTLTFKGSRDGRITDLYRYNVYLDSDRISKRVIANRIKLAESWFLENVDPKTKLLNYEYFPSSDSYSTDNNDVRQMGALWSMTELRMFLKSEKLSPLILKTFNHYLQYAKMAEDGEYVYFDIDGSKKLAYSAFMIFALVNMPEYNNRDEILRLIGNGIVHSQQEDGSYNTFFYKETYVGKDFYPGEAMLALMKLYNHSKDKKYLDSVIKAFPYYREYWRGNKNTAFIPWHSQVYLLLYKETKNKELADFVFEMNDWVVDNKFITQDTYKDRIGGFKSYNPGITSASHSEGLNDAYTLALLMGDKEYINKYYNKLRDSIRFVMQLQYTPLNTFYLENPKRANGGFRTSLVNNAQRNDHTQHAILAMLKAYYNNIY